MSGKRIMLTSYPGCGDFEIRKFFEKVTGVYTGSDMSPNFAFTDI